MNAFRVGTYVTHSARPAWGVGKVFGSSQQHVLVGFAAVPENERFKRMEWKPGLLEKSEIKGDAELDSWKVECDSTCHYLGAVEKPRRQLKAPLWTKEQAMERFLGKYNGGFPDAWYRSTHRDPRVSQHKAFTAQLPVARLRELAATDPRAAGDIIIQIFEAPARPLLHPKNELPRLKSAFENTDGMPAFLNALADLLDAPRPTRALFDAYLVAFTNLVTDTKKSAITWSIVSAIPYIAQPDRHMFVKQVPTCAAAAGLAFELKFNRKPNGVTYERVLAFSATLLEFITPRSGADMIDVQAFIAAVASE